MLPLPWAHLSSPIRLRAPPHPLPVRGADKQLHGCVASQWSAGSLLERACTCNTEQPTLCTRNIPEDLPGSSQTEGSYISLAGIPCSLLIWGSTPILVRSLLPSWYFAASSPTPASVLLTTHTAVSKETSQTAEKC